MNNRPFVNPLQRDAEEQKLGSELNKLRCRSAYLLATESVTDAIC